MKPFNDTYVMYWLLEFIDENSIIYQCKSSKKLSEICRQYNKLEDDKRFEVILSQNKNNDSRLLKEYCFNNDVIKIRKMIKMNLYWNNGLYGACRGGHIDCIKFLIDKGADPNYGLYGACWGGHLDIVKLMIEKGATKCGCGMYCGKSIEEHLKKKKRRVKK